MANDPENDAVRPDPALDSLEDRIASARAAEEARLAKEHAPYRETTGVAWGVISTMVGYPLGGIIIGFAIDQIAGTTPWVTIGLMFTAFIGGCLQAVRVMNNRQDRK